MSHGKVTLRNSHPLHSKQIDPAGVTDLASVLDSFQKLFEEDAPSSMDGMFDAHRQLQACIAEEDPNLGFERAHQIVRGGLEKWVWDLRTIAGEIVTSLAKIALANPKWVTQDPVSWARSRTKKVLDDWLDGCGSPRTPRILIWLRQACDGPHLDFDRYKSGRPEPWCAPAWAAQSRDWTNDPAKLDERITPERTEKLLRTWRRKFDHRLEYGLEKAKHAARVSLALQRAPRERHAPPDDVGEQAQAAATRSHNQVIAPAAPNRTPKPPTHPVLGSWEINRKLEKLEGNYARDLERKPAEIEFSSIVNPRCAAISWRVERLKQYAEELKTVYETEIEEGRFADTPSLWAAVYANKILPSVSVRITSLVGNLAHKLGLTGGGGPGEKASVEEAQRELSRLRAGLECELASALEHAEESKAAEKTGVSPLPSSPTQVSKLKSPLRMVVVACLAVNRDSTDKEIMDWLRQNNPKVIPARWDSDDTLPGKTFTKVRKLLLNQNKLSTAITRH